MANAGANDISYLKLIKYEIPNQVGNDIMDKFQCDSGSSTGMTKGLGNDRAEYYRLVRGRESLTLSFSTILSFPIHRE